MRWATLLAALEVVATRLPVAPTAARMASAPVVELYLPDAAPMSSPRSVMPAGGVHVALVMVAKKATSMVSATVVVIDGAVTVVELATICPPEALIGLAGSTPV